VSGPRSVIIVDEHRAFRAAIRRLLEGRGFVVRAEASCAEEAIALAERQSPDVWLVDVECDGGTRAVSDICAASPETAVVVLTASRDRDDFFDALRAGAIGYLPKDINAEWLPNALRGVLAGEAAIPRTLVASLVSEFRAQGRRRHMAVGRNGGSELTPREWEVAHMLADRLETKEIAERLRVSPVTVRRHVSSIVSKLEAPDRETAVAMLESAEGS
jgi:DNA-binding NarL/FixJ family response regulator